MNELPLIEFSEIADGIVAADSYQDIVSISEINANMGRSTFSSEITNPMRLDAVIMVMVFEGSVQVNIDYISYTITANTFVNIIPMHVIQASKPSRDFKAKLLILGRGLGEATTEKMHLQLENYMQLRKSPCSLFSREEIMHLDKYLALIREKIHLTSHAFHREVIINAIRAFLLELLNIMMDKKELTIRKFLTRKEEIMQEFLNLLLQNVQKEHLVTFYANRLCITPQYLSLVLGELTGKSASRWIDEALVLEAKLLLKKNDATIQQIADALSFSDQSVFGKFFRKNTGLSPMEYRKS